MIQFDTVICICTVSTDVYLQNITRHWLVFLFRSNHQSCLFKTSKLYESRITHFDLFRLILMELKLCWTSNSSQVHSPTPPCADIDPVMNSNYSHFKSFHGITFFLYEIFQPHIACYWPFLSYLKWMAPHGWWPRSHGVESPNLSLKM